MRHSTSSSTRANLSLVASLLALVVALSGTAYAALGPGSVDTKQLARASVTKAKIKNGAVTGPKIKGDAVTSAQLADGSVGASELAPDAVRRAAIADGAVAGAELADASVDSASVADRSLRLRDLGGIDSDWLDQTTTLQNAVSIAAAACAVLSLRTENPTPPGILGSMVVGTITSSSGGAVVSNSGAVLPTLLTATTQNGVVVHLTVCAGSGPQTIPAGSIVTWSLVAP